MSDKRVDVAGEEVAKYMADHEIPNFYQLGLKWGINSVNFTFLRKGELTPKLDDLLVEKGILPPKPIVVEVEACSCGEVHLSRRCPTRRPSKPRNRVSINVDNPTSAARSILRLGGNFANELVCEIRREQEGSDET